MREGVNSLRLGMSEFIRPRSANAAQLFLPNAMEEDTEIDLQAHVPNVNSDMSMIVQRRSLPIYAHRLSLLHALEGNGVLLVVAETGSGKSTREC